MRSLTLVLTVGCLLVIAAFLAARSASRAGMGSLTLAIADLGTDTTGLRTVVLQITNRGPYRVHYSDGFFLQVRDAAMPTYIPTTNLWLGPGEGAHISAGVPGTIEEWRANVGYIVQSPWNRTMMRLNSLNSTSMRGILPHALTSVRGAEVQSPWLSK